jgi:hypothetical protein
MFFLDSTMPDHKEFAPAQEAAEYLGSHVMSILTRIRN